MFAASVDIQSSEHLHSSFIYTANLQNVLAAELSIPVLDKPLLRTDLSVLSGLQHRLSGTRCHKQFSSVIL